MRLLAFFPTEVQGKKPKTYQFGEWKNCSNNYLIKFTQC